MNSNAAISLGLFLVTILPIIGFAEGDGVSVEFPDVVNSNSVTVTMIPSGELPEWMAVIVQPVIPSEVPSPTTGFDFDHAKWIPFKTSLTVDLGPGDGKRVLNVRFRYKGPPESSLGSGGGIEVRTVSPTIGIYSPHEGATSQPVIQLKGYVSRQPMNIKYTRANEKGQIVGSGEGLVNNQYFDRALFDFTTNYFTCYDVPLDPGTNTFVVSAEDLAGNHFSTKYVVKFTTVGDTNPPAIRIIWPTDGMSISGSEFELRGPCDDPTADVTALVCNEDGITTRLKGFGTGAVLVNVPLATGKNYITVVATDVATNSSLTNLTVTKSSVVLTMDPKPLLQDSYRVTYKVTGYCSDTNLTVFANDVKATINPDGHWTATDVHIWDTVKITADSGGDYDLFKNTWLPTVCSSPVENHSLSAGFSIMEVSTNEYNHYRVDLGFTNTSGRNIPKMTWMLPKSEARFWLHLYQTNKEVAELEYSGESRRVLATNLNIHHLGQIELTNIDGIISFTTNSTARIASLNLDRCFRLPPPGEYRLELDARLFKIAGDGQLIPFKFPPVSTMIKIIDQPSELVFYLNDLERQGKLVWGEKLNGLRIGVAHGLNSRPIKDPNQVQIFLQNTSTNDYQGYRNRDLIFPEPHGNLWVPNSNEQFYVSLYDASGKEVPKTTLGKKQGQPLSLDGQNPRKSPGLLDEPISNRSNNPHNQRIRPIFVSAKDATECGRFNLNDYFEIKTVGRYRMIFEQRFYQWNTNSILTGVIMPTVNVPLDVDSVPSK